MRRVPFSLTLIAALGLALAGCFHQSGGARTDAAPAQSGDGQRQATRGVRTDDAFAYDYLVLSLSWSPSFCETEAGARNRDQCGRDARPYAFVVHGLWPQNESGWPEYCAGDRAPWVEEETISDALRYMPSRRLILHEWKKHGTCMAADPRDYFAATELLFESIAIPKRFRGPREHILTSPQALEQSFLSANPQLSAEGVALTCGNRRDRANLSEMRICFTRDLQPRACGANERRECRAETLVLPPVRGG